MVAGEENLITFLHRQTICVSSKRNVQRSQVVVCCIVLRMSTTQGHESQPVTAR
jgi:hypothetical protein